MLQQQIDLMDEKIDIVQLNQRLHCNPKYPFVCQTMIPVKNITESQKELADRLKGPWNLAFRNHTMTLHSHILQLNETRANPILNPSFFQTLWNKLFVLTNWIIVGIQILCFWFLCYFSKFLKRKLNKLESYACPCPQRG